MISFASCVGPNTSFELPVSNFQPILTPCSPDFSPVSNFRRVFQTSDQMKHEFIKFLQTIFYQLDEEKVVSAMEKLLQDPNKSDEQIYTELLDQMSHMKKRFAPLWQIYSLRVLKKGMGGQAAKLLKNFQKSSFSNYMEIYDRRYLDVLRKIAKLPLNGQTIAVSDRGTVDLSARLQAGALFSSFPYKTHVSLNDPGCERPLENPEQTHKPIGDEISDRSIDLIGAIGGLHHIPKDRVDLFVTSLHTKLRPGGVILLRDHNVKASAGSANLPRENLEAIVALVHTFVNAADGVSWNVESKEVREFKSAVEWTELMKRHQFTPVSSQFLVLKDDPTENGMMAFVRNPENLDDLRQAIGYRSDCTRSKDSTYATWIEWGNVRFAKQYAGFIQNHHSYAFDYMGHLRQHWQHFYHYIKEARKDGISLKELVFSDNFSMNIFILFTTAIQCALGYTTSLPNQLAARWGYGKGWREVAHLTDLEKLEANIEKEYSSFIDHTPFYMFDYLGKIKQVWSTVAHSKETIPRKISNVWNGAIWTFGLAIKAAISAPVRALYTSEQNLEPDTVKILIKDPNDELNQVIERWEKAKDPEHDQDSKIEVLYATLDGYKLVSVPRYRPFTQICAFLSETPSLELLEVGNQKGISVDLVLDSDKATPLIDGARKVYEMARLQDPLDLRYATYRVNVAALKSFQQTVGLQTIEYIHE